MLALKNRRIPCCVALLGWVYEAIAKEAAKRNLSTSRLVEMVLKEWLKANANPVQAPYGEEEAQINGSSLRESQSCPRAESAFCRAKAEEEVRNGARN